MKKFLLLSILIFCQLVNAQEQEKVVQSVYIISLKGEISQGYVKRVKQKLKQIDRKKAKRVIIEIDTSGGEVASAVEVCTEIGSLAAGGVPVYAYVSRGWSGGALIALACDKIYMKKSSTLGAAKLPIPFGADKPEKTAVDDMKKQFAEFAKKQQYPVALAKAMVDPELEIVEIDDNGEPKFKTQGEWVKMQSNPNIDLSRVKKKKTVVKKSEYALFTSDEAIKYGFCRAIYDSREDLLREIGLAQYPIKNLKTTVEDSFVSFLTLRWVRIILIAMGILGILLEFWTPGFGVPGIMGLLSFALFFVGGYYSEVAEIWEILLFVMGIALLAAEIFVLPGFGVFGVAGVVLCFIGLLLSFQTFIVPSNQAEIDIFMDNLFQITTSVGIDILAFIVLAKMLPEGAPLRRLSVATVQKVEDGYSVAIPKYEGLEGKTGIAVSTLRPAGRVEIDGESYDVTAQGDFIQPDTKIKVLQVQGNRITVDKVEED